MLRRSSSRPLAAPRAQVLAPRCLVLATTEGVSPAQCHTTLRRKRRTQLAVSACCSGELAESHSRFTFAKRCRARRGAPFIRFRPPHLAPADPEAGGPSRSHEPRWLGWDGNEMGWTESRDRSRSGSAAWSWNRNRSGFRLRWLGSRIRLWRTLENNAC